MIAYYTARTEKPESIEGVKLFQDHGAAIDYISQHGNRALSVYQFNVDDRCESNNFTMETMVLLRTNADGSITFIGSGNWFELHEMFNIPFYYDFSARMKNHFNVSLSYFHNHFLIKEVSKSLHKSEQSEIQEPVDEDIISELFTDAPVDVNSDAELND